MSACKNLNITTATILPTTTTAATTMNSSTTRPATPTKITKTTTTTPTSTPTPTTKQIRTLTRTAEMDADGDVDAEVEALLNAAAGNQNANADVLPENVPKISTTTEITATSTIATPTPNATSGAEAASATNSTPIPSPPLSSKKPFKIKDVTRIIRKSLVAGSLAEMRPKAAEKFNKANDQLPAIHLDSDGTEIDDEEYFRTLEDNTELIAVFPGQHWLDPENYTALALEHERHTAKRLRNLVGRLQQNLLNDADLDSLSNMDPNSLADITGKELIEHMRDSDYYLQSESLRSTELSC